MKKLLTILAMASAATFLHAQGLVYMFGAEKVSTNTSLSIYNTPAGSQTGGVGGLAAAASSGQVYDYALLYASGATAPSTTAASLTSAWTFSGVTATNYSAAGSMFSPGGAGGTAATAWASGTAENVLVVGWSANLGTTWQAVSAELASGNWLQYGFFGVSGIGNILAGGGTSPATAVWGGSGVPIGSMTMYQVVPVPEPTTVALIGLGGLGLAMIRRKK